MSKMLLVFSSVLQFSSFSSCASTSLFSQAGLIHFVVLTTLKQNSFSFWLPRRCFGCCVLICASHTRESGESEVEKKLIPFFCRNPQDLHILESKSLDSFFYIQTSRKHFLVIVVIAQCPLRVMGNYFEWLATARRMPFNINVIKSMNN